MYIFFVTRGSRSYKPHGFFWAPLSYASFFLMLSYVIYIMWINKLNWKYERTSVIALNRLLVKALDRNASTFSRVFSISSIIKRIIICLIRWQLQFILILVDSSLTFGSWCFNCRGRIEEFITWWKNGNNLVTLQANCHDNILWYVSLPSKTDHRQSQYGYLLFHYCVILPRDGCLFYNSFKMLL